MNTPYQEALGASLIYRTIREKIVLVSVALPGDTDESVDASLDELELLVETGWNMRGRTICVLADAQAMPIHSYVEKFRDEFVAHLDGRVLQNAVAEVEDAAREIPLVAVDEEALVVEAGLPQRVGPFASGNSRVGAYCASLRCGRVGRVPCTQG